MGTSLSGLTPATTFDGLLKTSDNEPLDGTPKTIGDGSGVDSQLKIATNKTQIGNIEFVSSNVITTVSPSTNLRITSGGVGINSDYSTPTANTMLHIKGSGATSATTSLLVQNSVGNDSLKITDDSGLIIGNSNAATHNINSASSLPLTVSRLGVVRFSVSSDSGNGQIVLKGNTNNEFAVGTNGNNFQINDGVNTSQGAKRFSILQDGSTGIGDVTPTARLHVKVAANTDTIARFQDPATSSAYIDIKNDSTLTDYTGIFWGSRGKIRSKEVGPVFIDTLGGVIFANGNTSKSKIHTNGNMSVGTPVIAADTMLHIKGSGATSATTALLVENSAGTDMLKVEDDGKVSLGGLTFRGGIISGNAFFSNIVYGPNYYRKSNGQVKIGDGSAADTGVQLQVKGSGATSATFALKVQDSVGAGILTVRDDGVVQIDGSRFTFNSSALTSYADILLNADLAVGTTTIAANTRAHIKGSGATSATTALLVQNSAGTDLLKVNDAGEIGLGASPVTNTRAFIKSAGSTPATNAFLVQNSSSTNLFKVQSDGKVYATNLRSSQYSSSVELLSDVDFSGADNYNFNSTTGGFLPPRMTTTERDAISSPASGLMVYNTTTNKAQCYNGTAWQDLF